MSGEDGLDTVGFSRSEVGVFHKERKKSRRDDVASTGSLDEPVNDGVGSL